MSSKYGLRPVDGHHVEIDHDLFVVTAYHYEVDGLALVNVELLMRHKRREVNKITTTYFCCKFEPLSPTYLATAFYNIDSDLVATVMVRPGLCKRFEQNQTRSRVLFRRARA